MKRSETMSAHSPLSRRLGGIALILMSGIAMLSTLSSWAQAPRESYEANDLRPPQPSAQISRTGVEDGQFLDRDRQTQERPPGRLNARPRGPEVARQPGTPLPYNSRLPEPQPNPPAAFNPYNQTYSQPYPQSPSTSLQSTIRRKAEDTRSLSSTTPSFSAVDRRVLPREKVGGLEEVFRLLEARKKPLALNIWFPGAETLGNTEIAQGAAIAQGIALRVGNLPIVVTCTPSIVAGKFNVVVGTTNDLTSFIKENELKVEGNGHLLLKEISYRADTQLLVVTGRNIEGLDNAILSLGIARERLPGVATAAIADIVLPKAPPFLRREPLREESLYTFLQLHEIGTGMVMLPNRRLRLEFMLPGDFDPQYEGEMVFDLHYSYPGVEQRRSLSGERVSVRVDLHPNDPLTAETAPIVGGGARSAIGVPARMLRPGANALEISFPASGQEGFQIFSDSTLALPPWKHAPTLPDLQIFSRTTYPWIGQPDGSEMFIYLAGGAIETVESTWTILAKIAQTSNTVLYAAEYSAGGDLGQLNKQARHVLVVGDIDSIPESYRIGMPDDVFKELVQALEEESKPKKGINLKDLIMMGVARVKPYFTPPRKIEESAPPVHVDSTAQRQLRGFLGAFPPKEKQHGWVMLLAAESAETLRTRTQELVQPEYWQNLKGGSVFWNDQPNSLRVYSAPVVMKTVLTEENPDLFVEMPFGERYPTQTWYTALGCFFLFLLLVLIKTLQRYANMRDYQ